MTEGQLPTIEFDESYKFYVIQFLQQPFQNIDDLVCVPKTWIDDRKSKGVYAAYPSERLSSTRSLVKSGLAYDKEWKFYLCAPKYKTYCPWDAENIIRVESSKKIQAELEALQVLPSKPNAAQENKPKTKSKMNMRDELTQSLKRKVSECNRNIKAARIESATDVPEPTSNLSISEKKSVFCKDLAVKISRLPEIFVTKSKLSGLTDSEQENTNNTSCDKKMHSHHTEPGTSSGNCHRRTSDSEVDVTTSSSSSSLLQILKETPGPSYTRKNSSTSGTSSQSGQLTANTTQNASTISSSQKLDSKVSKQSISNPSKTDVNPPLQININNPPAKAERRQSVKKSTDVNTSNKIENYPNVTPQDKRLLQDFIASGGLQGVDHVYLESCLKYLQENTQVMQNAPVAPPNTQGLHLAPQMSPQALQAAQVVPLAMQAVEATPQTKQDEQATLQPMQATKSTPLPAQASQIALKAMLAEQVAPKRAINTPPGSLSYPITANTPALYQDPHERQITSERSSKKNDPTYSQSRAPLYLELRNENSATALPSKQLHTSASKKITKKKKIKKRERKGVNNEGGCNDSSDDSDSHNNDDSDTSDDDFVKNIKRNIKSNPRNSCKGNKLDDKGGTSSSNGNKQSDGKTHKAQDVKETADSDGDKNFKSDSNNPTDEPKRRGKKYPFVLPREYSPTNSRWTLLHQKKTYINKELLPKSRIYVHANKLAHVKRISNNYKEFARMLLTLIFTRKALRVCSWTGARANAFAVDENDVRPGLDENARQVMLTYVERFGRKKGWGIYDEQSVVNSVRAKIQDFRRIYTRQLMNKPKQ
ncbi:unnamed protein product [Spodoptera exigua]|nr:unnamed protein product [Spodoptera exigua]